ncbi:MAG: Ribosomal protein S17E [Candidatus Methanohalarchaeum thermophilum]|uniref:Small ribosomal subunit protein eS17 n=1 Tax=Methanohalarchaeum thermophilum TaxID=1903181 RepID=A0A1Q6DTD5_METT1|nr:MAG: Ribosomal protein S17E [Candidatus Methanohalarchaeum thermophilum]
MGRSRQTYIRNIGKKLLDYHGRKFDSDFDENKEKIEELTDINSKKLRNRVAGFITHVKSSEE